ncbi:MAG: hypothetical protein ACKJSK_18290 [Roseibacillus sp.]
MRPPVLLFICTSNVCRRRFAEALFNQAASQAARPMRCKVPRSRAAPRA